MVFAGTGFDCRAEAKNGIFIELDQQQGNDLTSGFLGRIK
jgi:hypothetical protein